MSCTARDTCPSAASPVRGLCSQTSMSARGVGGGRMQPARSAACIPAMSPPTLLARSAPRGTSPTPSPPPPPPGGRFMLCIFSNLRHPSQLSSPPPLPAAPHTHTHTHTHMAPQDNVNASVAGALLIRLILTQSVQRKQVCKAAARLPRAISAVWQSAGCS